MTEPPRDTPPPADPPAHDGGHRWQMFSVGLVALIVGAGLAWLIHGDSGSGGKTVTEVRRTVTAPAATAPTAVTVTQPPAETVVKTTTLPPVTVTAPAATVTAP